MDVVKTRLQAQPVNSAANTTVSTKTSLKVRYGGTLDAFKKIGRQEGLQGLWRGLGPAVAMTVPATTIYFSLYEFIKHEIEARTDYNYWTPLMAGCTARTTAVIVTSPIDLFRTNLQSHAREVGSIQLFRDIVKSGRWSTFWVGVRPTLWRDVPFSGIYWMSYESIRAEMVRSRQINSNFVTSLSAGAIAGAIAGVLTLPFDVLKTRTQMNVDRVASGSLSSSQLPSSTFHHMSEICTKEGVSSLFQGLLPRVFKVAPACAIMISTYEVVKDFFILRRHNQIFHSESASNRRTSRASAEQSNR